jgi:hypothetical protein
MTQELVRIKQALLDGRITSQEAWQQLTARKSKSWHSKEWKAMRAILIKDACEQCESRQPPMVLQHLWHPHSFATLRSVVRAPLYEAYKQEHALDFVEPEPKGLRETCPKCGSTAIHKYKDGRYICNGKKRYRVCGHLFQEPAFIKALTPEEKQARSREKWAASSERYKQFDESYGDRIAREATRLYIDESILYLSGEGTATFCKKCAFMWDERGCRLCKVCRTHYHDFAYPCCYTCSGRGGTDRAGNDEPELPT